MRSEGFIRRLGAVFDTRRLGYVSTLVAARIPPERLTEVAAVVSELPASPTITAAGTRTTSGSR